MFWIVGPSAMGSLNGIPISKISIFELINIWAISIEELKSGYPEVKYKVRSVFIIINVI